MLGFSIKSIVNKRKSQHKEVLTTQIVSAFTLVSKDPKRTVGWPRHSISPRKSVGRNQVVSSPVADTQFDKVAHWSEIDGNGCSCRKCNMTCTVKYSKCKIGLCLNKDRDYFKDFHNYLLVYSYSFSPENIPQATLIFCHFYYPCQTMLPNCNKL